MNSFQLKTESITAHVRTITIICSSDLFQHIYDVTDSIISVFKSKADTRLKIVACVKTDKKR